MVAYHATSRRGDYDSVREDDTALLHLKSGQEVGGYIQTEFILEPFKPLMLPSTDKFVAHFHIGCYGDTMQFPLKPDSSPYEFDFSITNGYDKKSLITTKPKEYLRVGPITIRDHKHYTPWILRTLECEGAVKTDAYPFFRFNFRFQPDTITQFIIFIGLASRDKFLFLHYLVGPRYWDYEEPNNLYIDRLFNNYIHKPDILT